MQLDGYSFNFANSAGSPAIFLLPLLDIMNHGAPGNAEVQQDSANGFFAAIAQRDIRRARVTAAQCTVLASSSHLLLSLNPADMLWMPWALMRKDMQMPVMTALRSERVSILQSGDMSRKGEEVTWSYSAAAALRADRALLSYCFLDRGQQPPLLASLDLPGGSFLDGAPEPPDDAEHAPGGRLCTQALPLHVNSLACQPLTKLAP
jgi:hypothetical protein